MEAEFDIPQAMQKLLSINFWIVPGRNTEGEFTCLPGLAQ